MPELAAYPREVKPVPATARARGAAHAKSRVVVRESNFCIMFGFPGTFWSPAIGPAVGRWWATRVVVRSVLVVGEMGTVKQTCL